MDTDEKDLELSLVSRDRSMAFFVEQMFLMKPVEDMRCGCCKSKRKRVWMGAFEQFILFLWDKRYLVKLIQAIAGQCIA